MPGAAGAFQQSVPLVGNLHATSGGPNWAPGEIDQMSQVHHLRPTEHPRNAAWDHVRQYAETGPSQLHGVPSTCPDLTHGSQVPENPGRVMGLRKPALPEET